MKLCASICSVENEGEIESEKRFSEHRNGRVHRLCQSWAPGTTHPPSPPLDQRETMSIGRRGSSLQQRCNPKPQTSKDSTEMSCRISSNELHRGVCTPLSVKMSVIGGEETDYRVLPVTCRPCLPKHRRWPPLSCAFAWIVIKTMSFRSTPPACD